MARKKFKKNNRRRNFLIQSFTLLFLFIGIGYATLSTNLGIGGVIGISKVHCEPNGTLYSVLECASINRELANQYTGSHHDSFTEEPSKNIYHWYYSNDDERIALANKVNVIFADHCWQMIRTTDTGGVKLLYNGEVEDGKCLNNRGSHVGYAGSGSKTYDANKWYGTKYTFNKSTNLFSLAGDVSLGSQLDSYVGYYTCNSGSQSGTCATLELLVSQNSTSYGYLQLMNNQSYSSYGTRSFNPGGSPAYVGYMYNTVYPTEGASVIKHSHIVLSSGSLSIDYWYSDDIAWDPDTNMYHLVNPFQITDTSEYPNLIGKYTFANSSGTYTNGSVNYIAAVSSSTFYYIKIENGSSISDYNDTYTYGDSYTDNGNGTYTINNSITINRVNWFSEFRNLKEKYICRNATNNTCSDLMYASYTSASEINYFSPSNTYRFANSFSYENGIYHLNVNPLDIWIINNANIQRIRNAHYTCWNATGECSEVYFVFKLNDSWYRQIKISNGKSVNDVLNEMLYNDNVNSIDSNIKQAVDRWYEQFLSDYSSYLEDTIFCNDRSQRNPSGSGWYPDGGYLMSNLSFGGSTGLSCNNETDRFSVSNSKAHLSYKIGIMTDHERELWGGSYWLEASSTTWLMTPQDYGYYECASLRFLYAGGLSNYAKANDSNGVRPVISLIPNITYTSGDGSMENPYVVNTN